jgi:dipeptidyl aminopeptidase/acylaminoacyl peptidase
MVFFDASRCLALVLLVACGGSTPTAQPVVADTPASPRPATPLEVTEPTVLSEAQRRRDAELVPLASAIVDAYPNWLGWYTIMVANWSPDGQQVLFGSLRDGTPQIYAGHPARPGEPPRVITSGSERSIWARYTLDGGSILHMRDRGGDERYHYWRTAADGSAPIDLTPDDASLSRHWPNLPRERPDLLVYAATVLPEGSTRVFTQSLSGGPPRLVYSDPTMGAVSDVTPDGARGLYIDMVSWSDSVVSELDLATASLRRIYPPDGEKATIHAAVYSHDGARIYISTDEGGESSVVLAFDAATGGELARYTSTSPHGAVLGLLASPTGDHVVVHVDAGNHGELRVLDARTLALVRPIEVPLADLRLGTFRADGGQFSIMISRPDRPADVHAVDPVRGDIRPLREDPRPGLEALPRVTATIAETPAHDGLTIPINVYLPAAAPGEPPIKRPTIVIFHGGPTASAAIGWDPYVRFLLALGYVVLDPNVRGSTGFGRAYEMADNREKRADWLKDLGTVNRWARAQPWCDPARVAVWGGSYGGYTTLMALTRQPEAWRVGVDLYGPADLRQFLLNSGESLRGAWNGEFGDVEAEAALIEEFSPMRDVDKIIAPLFVYAGQNDPRVPRRESDTIVRALRERNIPVEYMVAADEGHTVDRRENKIELLTRVARFLADAMPPP